MISVPIIALNNLISTIICFLSLKKVYSDYKQDSQNPMLKDFVWFYLFFGLFFVTLSLPGLVLKNTTIVATLNILSYFFLYISIGNFMKTPLEMSSFKEVKNILFIICMFLAIFIPLMGILAWEPASYHELVIGNIKLYDYLTFAATRAPDLKWFELLAGGGAFEAGFIASILFFINSKKVKEPTIKKKMLLIGIGMIFLISAAVFSYLIYFTFKILVFPQIIASILAWTGLLIMFLGIGQEKSTNKYNKNEPPFK